MDYKFEQAWACYHRGQYEQAIELLKELLSQAPNEALYHGLLAACLLEQRRLHAAEYEIGIGLGLNPLLPFLLLTYAKVLLFKNKHSSAIAKCDEALAQEPSFVAALLFKAELLNLVEEPQEAISVLQQALSIAPDSPSVLSAMAASYRSNGQNDKALIHLLEALKLDAQNESANILMGKVALDQGNIEDALYHARFAVSQNPSSESALRLLSDIKMRQNWFMGFWWRLNSKLSKMGNIKASLILISGYLIFSLLATILSDLGHGLAASIIAYGWLALVAYSWFCLPLYYKQLKKEIEQFRFGKDF